MSTVLLSQICNNAAIFAIGIPSFIFIVFLIVLGFIIMNENKRYNETCDKEEKRYKENCKHDDEKYYENDEENITVNFCSDDDTFTTFTNTTYETKDPPSNKFATSIRQNYKKNHRKKK